jgi:hypothetical protein
VVCVIPLYVRAGRVRAMVNEQLDAFRKRLRGPEAPQRMKAKEWVAILISVTALGLSAMTAYFTLVRQSEELRVFVGDAIPFVTGRTNDGRLQLEGNLDIAFMNTGTKPIIVLGVSLIVSDIEDRKKSKSCKSSFGNILFDADSFVVKEKEAVAKLLRFDRRRKHVELTEDGRIVMAAPKNSRGEPSRFVETCISIVGASPSRQPLFATIPLGDFEWTSQETAQSQDAFTGSRYFLPPAVLWTKRGTIFDQN